jgi:two-component system invasion response regulator UvrY
MRCISEPAFVASPPRSNQTISILVADDHPNFRSQLSEMLAEEFPMAAFCEAGDGDEVLVELERHPIDLLLLDINMPRRSGLEILPDVRALSPRTRVIVASVHPEEQFGTLAMEAGAHAYVNKDRVPEELIPTVKSVLSAGAEKDDAPAGTGMPAEGPGGKRT